MQGPAIKGSLIFGGITGVALYYGFELSRNNAIIGGLMAATILYAAITYNPIHSISTAETTP